MNFFDYRDTISTFIDEYMNIIKQSSYVENFISFEKHIKHCKDSWNKDSKNLRNNIFETFNEICFIHYLVSSKRCSIFYEPEVELGGKSIDLRCKFDDITVYFDIKSIRPDDLDQWNEFIISRDEGRIDGIVNYFKEGRGGEFWHDRVASRSKFEEHSKSFEDKISCIGVCENYYCMVFCGSGSDWHIDELEDFVEFYKTGKYVSWDHLASMSAHYNRSKNIVFNGSINNFAVLFRDVFAKEYDVIPFIRMGKKFRTYTSVQE